jgi:hypothetical protein
MQRPVLDEAERLVQSAYKGSECNQSVLSSREETATGIS